MDIDLGPLDEPDQTTLTSAHSQNGREMFDLDLETAVPHKVHIRGIEDFTTSDVERFSTEHFPTESPRVEWIDDTSANLIYDKEETALIALEHFTFTSDDIALSPSTPLRIRAAKSLSTHPGSNLLVRIAVTTDQKAPRAYEASRFYMMHPEYDPREQRRREGNYKSNGDYCRKRYSDDEKKRWIQRDNTDGLDPNIYDDSGSSSRRDSIVSQRAEGRRNARRQGDSYRPARSPRNSGSRDRSVSPDRRHKMSPTSYRSRDPHPIPHENNGKELFPAKSALGRGAGVNGKDLFSNKLLATGLKKELFPDKANTTTNHRRSDAFDAADETADLFASGLSVPFTDGPNKTGRRLPERVAEKDGGLRIRGLSRQQDPGISVRGGATTDPIGTIKEFFPGKAASNAGKELFAEKLEGRGMRRNRAEQFY